MDPSTVSPWESNWAWSLPLIVVTVTFHAYALGLLNQRVTSVLKGRGKKYGVDVVSLSVVGGIAICATVFHAIEVSMWAALYFLLGALPNRKIAMLYSLGAMTTYGNADLKLESQWQLMGSLEALNGWILFGLTTAFLFTVIREVWSYSAPHP
jgi:hypothetical protein